MCAVIDFRYINSHHRRTSIGLLICALLLLHFVTRRPFDEGSGASTVPFTWCMSLDQFRKDLASHSRLTSVNYRQTSMAALSVLKPPSSFSAASETTLMFPSATASHASLSVLSGAKDSSLEELQRTIEQIRKDEYPQITGKVYLDHGGTTLYAKSLVESFSADMIANLYGNPHSESSPSAFAGQRVDQVRARVLRFFGADPNEWDLVFVANASAAIKLVGDAFRDFSSATKIPTWYGYHRDAHTSLVGLRQMMNKHQCFTCDEDVNQWIENGCISQSGKSRRLGLFAYPGQSNMTGRRLPLEWCSTIRRASQKAPTYTLLDAAALASTAPLDLSQAATAPDFVTLSFYKIFGFPDLGALLVQKRCKHIMARRKFFGGGTVDMVISVNESWHAKKDTSIHDQLEDGTLPFHSIIALDHAISTHQRLYGPNPLATISKHTAVLGRSLFDKLTSLTHANGQPLVHIYKDEKAVYGASKLQGATVAFNVLRADGQLVGYVDVEKAADQQGIFVRSGSLCNPGGFATYLAWSPPEMKAAFAAGHRCSKPTQVVHGKATGVVRVSLGAMSAASDVDAFIDFLRQTYQDTWSDRAEVEILKSQTPRKFAFALRVTMNSAFSRSRKNLGKF